MIGVALVNLTLYDGFVIALGCWVVVHLTIWLPQYFRDEEATFANLLRQQVADGLDIDLGQIGHELPEFSSFFRRLISLPPLNAATLATALAAVLLAIWILWLALPVWQTLAWWVFVWGLLSLAVVDARTKLLPDMLTLPLLWLGLFMQLMPQTQSIGLEAAVWGAIAGYLPLWLLARVYQLIRKREGIGMGDLKLLAVMGAWSGAWLLPQILLLAALLAIVVFVIERVLRRHAYGLHEERPFGPAIVVAYFIVLLLTY